MIEKQNYLPGMTQREVRRQEKLNDAKKSDASEKACGCWKKSYAPGKAHDSACLASSAWGIGTSIESVHFEVRRQCMIHSDAFEQ